MRPIKFRVWDTIEKEWFDETTIVLSQDGRLHFWHMHKKELEPLEDGTYIPVFFTWLLDKNGKEIFEGDIVRLDHFTSDHSETIVLPIVFRDSWFVAYEQWMWGEKFYPMFTEVIWNIYENPELLK